MRDPLTVALSTPQSQAALRQIMAAVQRISEIVARGAFQTGAALAAHQTRVLAASPSARQAGGERPRAPAGRPALSLAGVSLHDNQHGETA